MVPTAPKVVTLLFSVPFAHQIRVEMNEMHASSATVLESAPTEHSAVDTAGSAAVTSFEFVGASDHTIAEAVRRALADASTSLRTLDGAGVRVIPEIDRDGGSPRFQVRLRVSLNAAASV